MQEFKRKRQIKEWLYSRTVVFLLSVMMLWALWGTYDALHTRYRGLSLKKEAESKLQELKDKENALESEVAYLGTERGAEEEIRGRYSVAKEGEKLVILVDNTKSTDTPEPSPTGFWKSTWLRFISIF